MVRKISITLFLCIACASVFAQVAPSVAHKVAGNANPLFPFIYSADPTSVEYNGRLYVYATNDTEQFLANNKTGGNSYDKIRSLVVMSTDDMVNWIFHGTIKAVDLCGGGWCFCSWAPSIVSRVEADGKTHFYLYFSNSGAGVGVLTSTSPIGPWTSPLTHALVDGKIPGLGECSAPMDPGVVIDDNGDGWLVFGGGDPNSKGTNLVPGNARIVKLGSDMITLASDLVEIKAPYHFEANELNYIGGKWIYTYCTTWAERKATDWQTYGSSLAAPSLCSMCYMVSDDPLNASSWQYRGEYFDNPWAYGYPGGNNHSHLHKYNNDYYFFYHTQWLESVSDYGTGGFRCIAVNKASVNETTQKIQRVTANNKGVTQLKKINPYIVQQAEMISTGAGIDYENFFNETDTSANDSHRNMVIGNIPAGSWTMVRGVDFGTEGATSFSARLKGTGTLEIRLDGINNTPVATLAFNRATMSYNKVANLANSKLKGVHDVYFYFPQATDVQFDEWIFYTSEDSYTLTSDVVVSTAKCQTVTGFGAAALGNLMAPVTDTQFIDYLYGPDSPVGLNIMRIEMSPSYTPDVKEQWWDTPYDWHGYLPVVKRANSYGAIVLATPWSPPAELKTNGSASGGQAEGVHGKLKEDCYDKLFPWMNKFLDYMNANGARIDVVSLQNEPDWWVSYSGCEYTPDEVTNLVANHAGELDRQKYGIQLMSSESLNHNPAYAHALLENAESEKHIDIMGGHIYGSRPLENMKKTAEIAAAHGKETWMTEHYVDGEEGHFFPTWDNNLILAQELNETMLSGANAYVMWYMLGAGSFAGDGVDADKYPDNEWGKPIMPRSMVMAHFSKNLVGTTRLDNTPQVPACGSSFESSAYIKDDRLIVMLLNMDAERRGVTLNLPFNAVACHVIQSVENALYKESEMPIVTAKNTFIINLPAKSLATYIFTIDTSQEIFHEIEPGEDITKYIKGFNSLNTETVDTKGWTIACTDIQTGKTRASSLSEGATLEAWAASWHGNNMGRTTVTQDVTLPKGVYELHVSGFYRASLDYSKILNNYRNGSKVAGGEFFARVGNKIYKTELADIYDCLSPTLNYTNWWGNGNPDGEYTINGIKYYYPCDQNGARTHIWGTGLCDNKLIIQVTEDESVVQLGVRKLTANDGDAINFRDIRIIYLGDTLNREIIKAQQEIENIPGWNTGTTIVAPDPIIVSRIKTGLTRLASATSIEDLNKTFPYLTAIRSPKIGTEVEFQSHIACQQHHIRSIVAYFQDEEYGTLILPLNVKLPAGMTGYTCSSVRSNNVLELKKLTDKVQNEPLIVKAIKGNKYLFVGYSETTQENVTKGLSTGVYDTGAEILAGSYILTAYDGKPLFVADRTDTTQVSKYQCYLTLPDSQAQILYLTEEDATSICDVHEDQTQSDNIYNVAGQRIDKLQKGINIVRGKKILVK